MKNASVPRIASLSLEPRARAGNQCRGIDIHVPSDLCHALDSLAVECMAWNAAMSEPLLRASVGVAADGDSGGILSSVGQFSRAAPSLGFRLSLPRAVAAHLTPQ